MRCRRGSTVPRDHTGTTSPHIAQVEQLLLPDGLHSAGRLCVLGAGNCNDLDLPRLAERFAEIHLVDLDATAVTQAVKRQGMEGSAKVHIRAPVDLTGIADSLATWCRAKTSQDQIDAVIRRAVDAPVALKGPFDVVLSPCILSQIVGYARLALGSAHALCRPAPRRTATPP